MTPPRPALPPTRPADEWYALPVLTGARVRLEPLALEHAGGYLAAVTAGDGAAEVFRWLTVGAPVTLDDARRHIATALAARARAERFAYAQIDLASGAFIGTTSLYDVVPAVRTVAIGHTWLGQPWWRTGHNRDAKATLLTHAFGTLGCVRVVWHTDIRNERSQRAIEGLGAVREGVLRKHRIRPDGSWRDTVTYSMTDDEYRAR